MRRIYRLKSKDAWFIMDKRIIADSRRLQMQSAAGVIAECAVSVFVVWLTSRDWWKRMDRSSRKIRRISGRNRREHQIAWTELNKRIAARDKKTYQETRLKSRKRRLKTEQEDENVSERWRYCSCWVLVSKNKLSELRVANVVKRYRLSNIFYPVFLFSTITFCSYLPQRLASIYPGFILQTFSFRSLGVSSIAIFKSSEISPCPSTPLHKWRFFPSPATSTPKALSFSISHAPTDPSIVVELFEMPAAHPPHLRMRVRLYVHIRLCLFSKRVDKYVAKWGVLSIPLLALIFHTPFMQRLLGAWYSRIIRYHIQHVLLPFRYPRKPSQISRLVLHIKRHYPYFRNIA